MAEFCLDCFNQLNGTDYTEADVWVDYSEWDICEGCGEFRPCVVELRPKPILVHLLDWLLKRKR